MELSKSNYLIMAEKTKISIVYMMTTTPERIVGVWIDYLKEGNLQVTKYFCRKENIFPKKPVLLRFESCFN